MQTSTQVTTVVTVNLTSEDIAKAAGLDSPELWTYTTDAQSYTIDVTRTQ